MIKFVVVDGDVFVATPQWQNYDNVCASAQAEWLAFRIAVVSHENGHYDVAKNFFNNTSGLQSYFSSMQKEESVCVEGDEPDLTQAAAVAYERFTAQLEQRFTNAMNAYHTQDDAYHQNAPYHTIDTSKDC